MLYAFQKHLHKMTRESGEEFNQIIRYRIGKKPSYKLIASIKEFIIMLPEIEQRINNLFIAMPNESHLKPLSVHFSSYMYLLDDLIPVNDKNGILGYLDDAYLAAILYDGLITECKKDGILDITQSDEDFRELLLNYNNLIKPVILEEAQEIDKLVQYLFQGENESATKLFEDIRLKVA